jgi:hypothetical protein
MIEVPVRRMLAYAIVMIVGAALAATWRATRLPDLRHRALYDIVNADEMQRIPLAPMSRRLYVGMCSDPYARVAADAAVAFLRKTEAEQGLAAIAARAPGGDPARTLHKLLLGLCDITAQGAIDAGFAFSVTLRSEAVLEVSVSIGSQIAGEQIVQAFATAVAAVAQRMVEDHAAEQQRTLDELTTRLQWSVSETLKSERLSTLSDPFADLLRLKISQRQLDQALTQQIQGLLPFGVKRSLVAMPPQWLNSSSRSESRPIYADVDTADPASLISRFAAASETGLLASSSQLELSKQIREFVATRSKVLQRSEAFFRRWNDIRWILDEIAKRTLKPRNAPVVALAIMERPISIENVPQGVERLDVTTCGLIGGVASAFLMGALLLFRAEVRTRPLALDSRP